MGLTPPCDRLEVIPGEFIAGFGCASEFSLGVGRLSHILLGFSHGDYFCVLRHGPPFGFFWIGCTFH